MKINAELLRPQTQGFVATLAACALLGACHSGAADKLAAARQALQATGEYQIEAQDAERGLLTVRSKRDGTLRLIDVNSAGAAAASPAVAATPATRSAPADAPPSTAQAATGLAASSAAAADPARVAADDLAAPAPAAMESPTTGLSAVEAAGGGLVLAHGPRIHIERATGPAATAAPSAAVRQTVMTGVSFNHAVICRSGDRIRLQQVRVDSPSAGIVLQAGCQLELIDSDVHSGDVALVVDAGASLRIENSTISGRIGSLQASNTTRVSSWASDFTGPTLLDGAEFIDRGGNTWQ